jgi:competence protein ComEC
MRGKGRGSCRFWASAMRVLGEDEGGVPARRGLVSAILDSSARLLEAEQDRWMLWVSVLFAAGILTYFALADEPGLRLALALLIGALGFCLALRHAPLGLCIGGAAFAFATGFAVAKLRTEMVRAPGSRARASLCDGRRVR